MTEVRIEVLQNKHKIHIEYPIKLGAPFASIDPERDGLVISVFTKYGDRIDSEDIKMITMRKRDKKDDKEREKYLGD